MSAANDVEPGHPGTARPSARAPLRGLPGQRARPRARVRVAEAPPVTPVAVSQLTSLAVLGIDERRFRETFGKHPKASRVGKLLVIDVADARDALRSMRGAPTCDASTESADDDGPRDVDEVLARPGRRRIA